MKNHFTKYNTIFLIILILVIYLIPYDLEAQEEENILLKAFQNLSISIGGEGYLQTPIPEERNYKEHSYFYKIYIQARSPKGFKIRWSHLDTHYRFCSFLNNSNSEKLDKIQLELQNQSLKSWNMKLLAGHLDNFTFAQGLTFDSHYHYGYLFKIHNNNISFETSYMHTSIHLDGFWCNRLCLFNRIGLSLIYINDLYDYYHYMPGMDFSYSISIFKTNLSFVGEIRQNYIDRSHFYHPDNANLSDISAYLAGIKFNITNDKNDKFNIYLLVRKYGRFFNNNYNHTSHYTSLQYRSPEVLHIRYDNWLHYLFLPGASQGISISSILQKHLFNKFIIKNDFEWVSQKWIDSSYKKEVVFFDFSLSYLFDKKIYFCLGLRNKALNNYNIPYNRTKKVSYTDDYYFLSPLFIETQKVMRYFKIGFKF